MNHKHPVFGEQLKMIRGRRKKTFENRTGGARPFFIRIPEHQNKTFSHAAACENVLF